MIKEKLKIEDGLLMDGTEKGLHEIASRLTAQFGPQLAISCSFSVEDLVVVDVFRKADPEVRVFSLDTGRLPEETYQCAERVRARYDRPIEWYFPERESVEALERNKGLYSFRDSLENRKECCRIRKVEPLGRALAGLAAWVTGLRREQSPTRESLAGVEKDDQHGGLLKINPLAAWTAARVWDYARKNDLPVSRLYDAGYTSIGCAPCTRPVRPGEHERAGRWWWEDPAHKECGLHAPSCGTNLRRPADGSA